MGLFKKIKEALGKTRNALKQKLEYLFKANEIDDEFFEELEEILISSDVGISTSTELCDELRVRIKQNHVKEIEKAKEIFKELLKETLMPKKIEMKFPAIITVVGVNGVGKTTSIGKLAYYFKEQNKNVTLVAGDTFRAAASDQLTEWANRNKVKIVKHSEGADAGAVVYDGIASAKAKNTDVLIVDTAGRLHTKVNLMEELGKIHRIIEREAENLNVYNFIVLDATTGQNALSQIEHFDEYISLDGIILSKLDGTAKGGVVFAIAKEYETPVVFVGTGEGLEDIETFDANEFVDNLF